MENIKKDEMDAELPSLPQPMRLQYERQHVPCEKECYTADQTLAYGRACMALRQPAQHIPGNFTTHRTAWRDAITECINHETNAGQPDRAAYWEHELAAYDRAFARLLDNPEAVRSPAQCAAPDERTDAGQAYKALDRAQKVIDWHTSIAMMTDDDLDTVRKYLFAKLNEAAPAAQPARPSLFESKLAGLEQRGYEVIGRILHKDGQYALFDSSCRWLTRPQYQRLMHEQDDSLFGAAQPEAKAAPVDAQSDLHDAIMRLPCSPYPGYDDKETRAYKYGHKDARDAAAELAAEQSFIASQLAKDRDVKGQLLSILSTSMVYSSLSKPQRLVVDAALAAAPVRGGHGKPD